MTGTIEHKNAPISIYSFRDNDVNGKFGTSKTATGIDINAKYYTCAVQMNKRDGFVAGDVLEVTKGGKTCLVLATDVGGMPKAKVDLAKGAATVALGIDLKGNAVVQTDGKDNDPDGGFTVRKVGHVPDLRKYHNGKGQPTGKALTALNTISDINEGRKPISSLLAAGVFENVQIAERAISNASLANSGVNLPSNASMGGLIADMNTHGNTALGKKLSDIKSSYESRSSNLSENDKKNIASALTDLKKTTQSIYKSAKIADTDMSHMLALHTGPYSAAAILASPPASLIKDATVTIDKQKIAVNPQSVKGFIDEMKAAGVVPFEVAYENMKVLEFQDYTNQFCALQQNKAKQQTTQALSGALPANQKQDVNFMASILENMDSNMGGFISLLFSIMTMMNQGQTTAQQQTTSTSLPTPITPTTPATQKTAAPKSI